MARRKTSTGLYLDRSVAHLYQLRIAGRERQVVHDRRIPVVADPDTGEPDWRRLRVEAGRGVREVVVAAPASAVLFRVVRLPSPDPAELPSMVEIQVDKLSPFPVEEIVWDYVVLGRDGDATLVGIALAGCDRIEGILEPVRAAGFEPVGVDVDILSLHRWASEHDLAPTDGWGAIALCRDAGACLLVLCDGVPRAIRNLVLPPAGDNDAHEFERMLTAVAAETGNAPQDLLVVGEPALRDRVASTARAAGLTARTIDGADAEASMDGESPAAGLASGALADADGRIDLLPPAWHRRRRRRERLRLLAFSAGAVAAIYAIGVAAILLTMRSRENRIAVMQAEIDSLAPQLLDAQSYMRRTRQVSVSVKPDYSGLEQLRLVASAMPDGVSLNQFVFRKGQRLTIRGMAMSKEIVTDYLRNLEDGGRYEEVKTSYIRDHKVKNQVVAQDFEFVCTFPEIVGMPVADRTSGPGGRP